MKKFISIAIVVFMLSVMTMASSAADLVSQINVAGIVKAPTLDGAITEEEWGAPIYTVNGGERKQLQDSGTAPYLVYAPTAGSEEAQANFATQTTGKAYARWDKDNLYLGYVVSYPTHKSDAADGNIWQDACVQPQVIINWPANAGEAATNNMYELGFSLADDLKTVKTWLWYPTDKAGADIPGAKYAVARKGTETTYEIAVSWKDTLGLDPATVKEGSQYGLASAYNFKDEAGGTLQFQVGGSLFTKIPSDAIPATLTAAPAAETPTEEKPTEEKPTEQTPTNENPTTADASAIMYVLAALSTLGGSVALGKRK